MFSFLPSLKTIERPSYENKGYDSVWCTHNQNAEKMALCAGTTEIAAYEHNKKTMATPRHGLLLQ
jgi:hypothetical protein